jgi:ribosomal protein S4
MNIHKIRPKLKKYTKIRVFLNLKKNKKETLNFFSPDLTYLTSKSSNKIKDHYQLSLFNRRKLKLLLGFQRTSLLKKSLKTEVTKNLKSWRFLNEIEFCSILERRVDILLYRLGFVTTLFEAKHLISHKKIKINNQENSSFSRLLKKGDIISFVPSVKTLIKERLVKQLKSRDFYFNTFYNLEINLKTLKIIVLTEKIDLAQQIQHYSFSLNWNTIMRGN